MSTDHRRRRQCKTRANPNSGGAVSSKDVEDAVKLKNDLQRKGNKTDLADMCNFLGNLYAQADDHCSALAEHQQELDLCEQANDKLGVAIAHRKVGECYASLEQFQRAFEHVRAYLSLAQSLRNIEEEERALMTLGRTHLLQAECMTEFDLDQRNALDRAERSFSAALKLTTSSDMLAKCNSQEIATRRIKLLRNLACVRDLAGETRTAIGELKLAVEVCEQHVTLSRELIKLHEFSAELYRKLGENDAAFSELDLAVDYVRRSTLSPAHARQALRDVYLNKTFSALEARKFRTCRHCIKKLVRHFICSVIKSRDEFDLEKILRACETVKKLFAEMLALRERKDYRQSLQVMEKLGDAFCSVGGFYAGYDQYKRALDVATRLSASSPTKLPLCVSVAQTCLDLRRYDEARTFFLKELELRPISDYKQRCSTYQSLAVCTARSSTTRDKFADVEKYLRSALLEAEKAHSSSLQIGCLQMLQQYFEIVGSDGTAAAPAATESLRDIRIQLKAVEALAKRKSLYAIDDEDDDDENDAENEESTNNASSDVTNDLASGPSLANLSEISDSDNDIDCDEDIDRSQNSNAAEGDASSPHTRRPIRKRILKRNEKGEFPLSVAVIKGMDKLVKKLVEEEGHPVNDCADFAGWLPLHEAANYNHHAIARYLLSKGAKVNADTKENRRTTPLMSAAAGGALETMQTLLEHGADVRRINSDKLSALDHLYMHFEEAKHDRTFRRQPEKLARFFDMQDALITRMRARGMVVDEKKIIKRTQYLEDVRTDQLLPAGGASTFVGSEMQGIIANRVVADDEAVFVDDDSVNGPTRKRSRPADASRNTGVHASGDPQLMYQSVLMGVGSSAMRRAMYNPVNDKPTSPKLKSVDVSNDHKKSPPSSLWHGDFGSRSQQQHSPRIPTGVAKSSINIAALDEEEADDGEIRLHRKANKKRVVRLAESPPPSQIELTHLQQFNEPSRLQKNALEDPLD